MMSELVERKEDLIRYFEEGAKPREQWRAGMTPDKRVEELDRIVKVPGLANVWVPPIASACGFGVTVMVARAADVTVTVAEAAILPTLATTVLVYVAATVPAVNRPLLALMVPPPAATDQLGETDSTWPAASLTTAVNC